MIRLVTSEAAGLDQIIIHVDMDAFYASVEIRDDPSLKGKPVIIGAMPHERGVVATCSYEAREFGVHSAMNVKEAYRLCPQGVFMHPHFEKYKFVSGQLHAIWDSYCDASEGVALDEAYLDVTRSAGTFDRAAEIARTIKERTLNELGLTCSVGVAYSKAAAKTASEEMKPNGYFEIRTQQDYIDLIIDRDVSVIPSVGKKTTEKLHEMDIMTVRDLLDRQEEVIELLGSHGTMCVQLASGIDVRQVVPYRPEDAKSISREITFQEDVFDYGLLSDVLFLLAMSVEDRARRHGLHGSGVVLKITYSNMRSITRSRNTASCQSATAIHREAVSMLMALNRRPVRLIGVGVYNLSQGSVRQMTLDDLFDLQIGGGSRDVRDELRRLRGIYNYDFEANLDDILHKEVMHRVTEHMRVQRMISMSSAP
jgi:DNA polymerase-4/DNA polymerase IV (DinB-like DNA polymerase)